MIGPLLPPSPPSAYRLLVVAAAAFMFATLLAGLLYNAAQNAILDRIAEDNRREVQEHRHANQADHNQVHEEHRQICELIRGIARQRDITTEPCEQKAE